MPNLVLSAALGQARAVRDQLYRAERMMRVPYTREAGLRELRLAIAKLDEGIRQAERLSR